MIIANSDPLEYEFDIFSSQDELLNAGKSRESDNLEGVVGGPTPSIGSGIITPAVDYPGGQYPQPGADGLWPANVWTGYPTDAERTSFSFPSAYVGVWFAPALATVVDAHGVSLHKRHRQLASCFARTCGLAWYEVPYDQAQWRFHYAEKNNIVEWSRQYQNNYGSGYWVTVVRNGRVDIYTNDRVKPAFGSGKIGWINAIRFPGRALMWAFGYRDNTNGASAGGMADPNMSAGFNFSYPEPRDLAGFSWPERVKFGLFGPPWLWRHGSKGLEAYP